MRLGKMLQPEAGADGDTLTPYLRAGSLATLGALVELPEMYASSVDIARYEVHRGDLVVAEGGDCGQAGYVPDVPVPTIIQNSLHRIRTKSADLRFIRYCLDGVYTSGWLEVLCNKSTFGHLTQEKLAAMRIPLPSIVTQRGIADYLDRETAQIDALIDAKEQMVRLLEEQLAVARVDLVVGAGHLHRRHGPNWLGTVPAEWGIERLKFVAQLESGHTPNRQIDAYWVDCTIPWITLNDVSDLEREWRFSNPKNAVNQLGFRTRRLMCFLPTP